jgi:hypothetical protein
MRTLLCISREVGVGDIIAASSQDYYSLISQFQYHAVQVKVNAKRHTSVASARCESKGSLHTGQRQRYMVKAIVWVAKHVSSFPCQLQHFHIGFRAFMMSKTPTKSVSSAGIKGAK